jgi:hypothetical protein
VRGENRWRRRRLAATLVWLAARVGPFVLAVVAAFAAARLIARPANPEALLWWLGIAAVGLAALHLLHGLATRARAFAALLGVTATFPTRPPSRAAIAWAMPDSLRLRQGLDELAVGDWTTEVQSRRAALVAALWALDESIRHPGMLWRPGDGDVGVRLTEGDVPGLLQLVPPPSIRHRTVTAGAGLAAIALLLSSVTLGVPSDRSSQLANRGPADVPSSSPSTAPVAPVRENTAVPDAGGPTEVANPPAGAGAASSPEPSPTATASAPTAPTTSPVPQPPLEPSSRPVVEAETAPQAPATAPQAGSGGLVALDASVPNDTSAASPAATVVMGPSFGALLRPAGAALLPVTPSATAGPGASATAVEPGPDLVPSLLAPSVLVPSLTVPSVLTPSVLAPSAPSRTPALVAPSTPPDCATTAGDLSGATPCATATDGQPPAVDESLRDDSSTPVTTAPAPPPDAGPSNAAPSDATPPAGASSDEVAATAPTDATPTDATPTDATSTDATSTDATPAVALPTDASPPAPAAPTGEPRG